LRFVSFFFFFALMLGTLLRVSACGHSFFLRIYFRFPLRNSFFFFLSSCLLSGQMQVWICLSFLSAFSDAMVLLPVEKKVVVCVVPECYGLNKLFTPHLSDVRVCTFTNFSSSPIKRSWVFLFSLVVIVGLAQNLSPCSTLRAGLSGIGIFVFFFFFLFFFFFFFFFLKAPTLGLSPWSPNYWINS